MSMWPKKGPTPQVLGSPRGQTESICIAWDGTIPLVSVLSANVTFSALFWSRVWSFLALFESNTDVLALFHRLNHPPKSLSANRIADSSQTKHTIDRNGMVSQLTTAT